MKMRLLAVIIPLIITAGCAKILPAPREIGDFQLISVAALDRSEEPENGITLTLYAKGVDEDSEPFTVSQSAATAASAFQEIGVSSGKHVFLGHTHFILIGESLSMADGGLDGCLDYILRDPAIRPDIRLYIVKGNAGELLTGGEKDSDGASVEERLKSLELEARQTSVTDFTGALDAAAAMEGGGAILIPALKPGKPGDGKGEIEPDGFAVVKDRRLSGYIDPEDAIYVNILRGRFYNAVIEPSDGARTSARISRMSRRYALEWSGDTPSKLIVDVSFHAQDADSRSASDAGTGTEGAVQKIRDGVARALEASRQAGADYLGIASALDIRYPFRFARHRDGWEEEFTDLDVEVRVWLKK